MRRSTSVTPRGVTPLQQYGRYAHASGCGVSDYQQQQIIRSRQFTSFANGRRCSSSSVTPSWNFQAMQYGDLAAGTDWSRQRLPRHPMRHAAAAAAMAAAAPSAAELRSRREMRTYELPSAENFSEMRLRLLRVTEGLAQHRKLVDRFAGVDLNAAPEVADRINEKYLELVFRMPELEKNLNPGRAKPVDDFVCNEFGRKHNWVTSRSKTPSSTSPPVSELRGKIRRLISRNKREGSYY